MTIRPARDADWDRMRTIFYAVVATGTTYVFTPDTSDEDARAYWLGPGISTYVAVDAEDVDAEGRILGNTAAVRLWRKLGFIIVGTLPNAFRHEDLGLVDVYSMYRSLDDITP